MNLTNRKCLINGHEEIITLKHCDWYKIHNEENENRDIHYTGITLTTTEVDDYVEIKIPSPYGDNFIYGVVTAIRNDSVSIDRVSVYQLGQCTSILPEVFYRKSRLQQPIHLDSIGVEYESSPEKVDKVQRIMPEIIESRTSENNYIKELQFKPIPLQDFPEFLRVFQTLADIDNFEYEEGKYCPYSSSMHTHLSAFSSTLDLITRQNWTALLAPFLFSKKPTEFSFRDASMLPYFEQSIRASFDTNDLLLIGSKSSAITLNRTIPARTVEYRINETPLPLWVYLVPIFSAADGIFKQYYDEFMIHYTNCLIDDVEDYEKLYNKKTKALVRKALRLAKSFKPQVLAYWKDKVTNYSLFNKVMTYYFKSNFNANKTSQFIKEL